LPAQEFGLDVSLVREFCQYSCLQKLDIFIEYAKF
jgi:hypothetical protein